MFIECMLLLSGLLGSAYLYFTSNDNFWKLKGIPYLKPDLFFGNFKEAFLGRRHFGQIYADIYNKFKESPLVGILKCKIPVLLVRDPDFIRTVLVTEFKSFMDSDFTVNLDTDPLWASNPFANKGELWKSLRARWTPHMTPVKVKQAYSSMVNRADVMVKHINRVVIHNPVKKFHGRDLITSFFTDSIALGTFGVEINSFENPRNPFKDISSSIFATNYWNGLLSKIFVVIPWLAKYYRFGSSQIVDMTFSAAREIMKCQKETGWPQNDMYTTLTNYSIADGKANFSETDLAGRIFGMLLDGSETTSGPLSYGLYEIACNPEVQTKMRIELDEAAEANGGSLNYDKIIELPYMDMVLSETLRHYPPLIHLARVCNKSTLLKKGDFEFQVPVGMILAIPTLGIHMDPMFYPDPEKFDPERFAPGMAETRPKGTFLPFGDGPRSCIGKKLATLESKVVLAHLVKNFIIHPVGDRYDRPIPVDPDIVLMRARDELYVTFHPRP